MAVKDLHEAAVVLQGAYQAIAKVLDETEPLERAYHRETYTLEAAGKLGNDAWEQRSEATGYAAFHLAAMRLGEFFHTVEETYAEEARKRLDVA